MIFFDNQKEMGDWHTANSTVAILDEVFGLDFLYTPTDFQNDGSRKISNCLKLILYVCVEWPVLDDIVARGKRLIILSGQDYGADMAPYMFAKYSVCGWSEPGAFTPYPTCSFEDGDHNVYTNEVRFFFVSVIYYGIFVLQGSLVRAYSSELQYGILDSGGHYGTNDNLVDEESLPGYVQCNTNVLGKIVNAFILEFL